jgi:23S rRNA pseudouridine955/2504/2580 synthase
MAIETAGTPALTINGGFSIPILYENEDVFVFNKPAGLAVQGGQDVKRSLDTLLAAHWTPRPLLVHRLDKETSGAILTARHKEAAAFFANVIKQGRMQKTYRAVCKKSPALPREGIINDALAVKGQVKNAATRYRKLAETDDFVILEIALLTGRMHQIRRHLSALGAPVIGDDKYGDFALNKKLKREQHIRHLLLHSARLTFPASTGTVTVEAPLPPYFPQPPY